MVRTSAYPDIVKIYKIRNSVNDKIYLGSTTQSLSRRMAGHREKCKLKPDRLIYQEMNKIGVDKFFIELVESKECPSYEHQLKYEREWFDKLKPELNMTRPIVLFSDCVCNECGHQSKRIEHLENHKRIHSGEKPFKCDECDMAFNQKIHLTIHKRRHSGEKPYKCEVCPKEFIRSDYLKNHLIRHMIDDYEGDE